ncbi:MAG: tetratricopeptide repeat protein [bacterium]
MAKQWVKNELKKDPLVTVASSVYGFVGKNLQTSLIILVVFVVAAVFSVLLLTARRKNINSGFAKLIRAESAMYSDPYLSLSLCDRVISEFHASPELASLALYIKGNALFMKDDYEGALKVYMSALDSIDDSLKPDVFFSIAKTEEALNRFNAALKTYQQFLTDFDRHYLSPEAYLSSARILIKENQPAQAEQFIEVIKGRFQGTKWADYAEELGTKK